MSERSENKIAWPQKTREIVRWVLDSTRWNGFEFRPDDIVISTWSKTGTTWMQQIVRELVFAGENEVMGASISPWIDTRLRDNAREQAEAQTHRRFLKTHLPIDALVYAPEAKYIYVARDGRDVYWSWHNHHAGFTQETLDFLSGMSNPPATPYTFPDPDLSVAFNEWLDSDGYPNEPFFSNVQGWWDARHLPNLLLVHFADLKADPRGEIERIAGFLGIEVAATAWPNILKHSSFEWMRAKAVADEGFGNRFVGGGGTFINKGTNDRWRDVLTRADLDKYQKSVSAKLSRECAEWLENGGHPKF